MRIGAGGDDVGAGEGGESGVGGNGGVIDFGVSDMLTELLGTPRRVSTLPGTVATAVIAAGSGRPSCRLETSAKVNGSSIVVMAAGAPGPKEVVRATSSIVGGPRSWPAGISRANAKACSCICSLRRPLVKEAASSATEQESDKQSCARSPSSRAAEVEYGESWKTRMVPVCNNVTETDEASGMAASTDVITAFMTVDELCTDVTASSKTIVNSML